MPHRFGEFHNYGPPSQEASPVPIRDEQSAVSSRLWAKDAREEEDEEVALPNVSGTGMPETRQELIARLKREKRPLYRLNNADEDDTPLQADLRMPDSMTIDSSGQDPDQGTSYHTSGSTIERSRSALHSGDFGTHQERPREYPSRDRLYTQSDTNLLSISPPAPWYNSTITDYGRSIRSDDFNHIPTQLRDRATSQSSLSVSYASRPPTSPLAVQSNSMDFDANGEYVTPRTPSPDKTMRRRTFSPGSLQHLRSDTLGFGMDHTRTPPPLRKHDTYPRQAHQPRRSISSLYSFSGTQSPLNRSRRQSLYSDSSPLQGAPMVGGYEESILRGRMSTLPSRPLDFVAQIGVLGKGDCKPSLRCPPHISVPFPAVFYDYGLSLDGKGRSEVGPSPYVGMIDLEDRGIKSKQEHAEVALDIGQDHVIPSTSPIGTPSQQQQRPSKKPRMRGPKYGPKGSYRIPQQGQLQIIIKNPHKTAVKLFLVPYDLSGMKPNEKTFIRQRSYSAGPIIDMPLSARKNFGTDRPEASLTNSDDPRDRPVLRYLVHLHICCPSRGRFYLYKSIRVVFANRVPDGKEKLRNEVQLPEPRYTSYRPDIDTTSESWRGPRAIQAAPSSPALGPSPIAAAHSTTTAGASRSRPVGPSDEVPFTFRRKPLVTSTGDGSAHGSFSSGISSSRVDTDGSGSDRSPVATRSGGRSSGDHSPPEARSGSPGLDATSPRLLSPLQRSHGSGLLAQQLKSWEAFGPTADH